MSTPKKIKVIIHMTNGADHSVGFETRAEAQAFLVDTAKAYTQGKVMALLNTIIFMDHIVHMSLVEYLPPDV